MWQSGASACAVPVGGPKNNPGAAQDGSRAPRWRFSRDVEGFCLSGSPPDSAGQDKSAPELALSCPVLGRTGQSWTRKWGTWARGERWLAAWCPSLAADERVHPRMPPTSDATDIKHKSTAAMPAASKVARGGRKSGSSPVEALAAPQQREADGGGAPAEPFSPKSPHPAQKVGEGGIFVGIKAEQSQEGGG